MIAKLQAENPKLIYTVTTPVSQIAKKALAGSGIPIVFSAVTDPVAAKLVPSWDKGDDGMTGASDLQDIAAVLEFTHKFLPDAKRLAVPYNPGEANDVALLEKVQELAPAAGFTVVPVGIDNVNDILQRVTSVAGKADVIYTPASNLIQPAIAAVSGVTRRATAAGSPRRMMELELSTGVTDRCQWHRSRQLLGRLWSGWPQCWQNCR